MGVEREMVVLKDIKSWNKELLTPLQKALLGWAAY